MVWRLRAQPLLAGGQIGRRCELIASEDDFEAAPDKGGSAPPISVRTISTAPPDEGRGRHPISVAENQRHSATWDDAVVIYPGEALSLVNHRAAGSLCSA